MNTFYARERHFEYNEDTRFQCRHIFPDGHRCGSPCLRSEQLCYYHHTTRRPIADAPARKARRGSFNLNLADLVDRSGIQLAIAEVLQRIALNDIDPRRAGLLLYGLQTASLNLPKPPAKPAPVTLVDEITQHPTLGILAPPARIADLEPRSSIDIILEELKKDDETQDIKDREAQDIKDREAQEIKDREAQEIKDPEAHEEASEDLPEVRVRKQAEADLLQPTTLPEIQACEASQSTPNPNPLRTLHTNTQEGGCRTPGAPSIRGLMRMGGMNNPSDKLTTDGILPLRQTQRPGKTGTRNT